MRHALLAAILCGFLLTTGLAAGPDDQKDIQGTWQLVSGQRQGQTFDADLVKKVTLIFSGDKLTTKKNDSTTEAKFGLHFDTDPKGIDLDMDGALGLGIYVLSGDDLTILHGEVGDPRPDRLDVKALSRPTLLVLKRLKP